MAIINKITAGYVLQVFDTDLGEFTSQEFVAGDVEYENANAGEPLDDVPETVLQTYLPFDMVQPAGFNEAWEGGDGGAIKWQS